MGYKHQHPSVAAKTPSKTVCMQTTNPDIAGLGLTIKYAQDPPPHTKSTSWTQIALLPETLGGTGGVWGAVHKGVCTTAERLGQWASGENDSASPRGISASTMPWGIAVCRGRGGSDRTWGSLADAKRFVPGHLQLPSGGMLLRPCPSTSPCAPCAQPRTHSEASLLHRRSASRPNPKAKRRTINTGHWNAVLGLQHTVSCTKGGVCKAE